MEEISVKGKTYVKAKLIARELGYTNDYVGQLCRAGKVDAELVGRTWYVDPESIKSHKKTRYRSTKVSTKRELHSDVLEALAATETHQPARFYDQHQIKPHARIQYEEDDAELFPTTKKPANTDKPTSVELPVELADAASVPVTPAAERQYNFVAPERQETKFYGTLKVTDVVIEVPVAGEEEKAHQVTVTGSTLGKPKPAPQSASKPQPKTEPKPEPKVHHTSKKTLLQDVLPKEPNHPAVKKQSVAVPVTGTDEVVELPVTYRLTTVAVFVAGLVLATAVVGMQATVTATQESLTTNYSFVVDHLFGLLYLFK